MFAIIKNMKQLLKKENPVGYCLLPVLVFLLGKQVMYGLLLALLQEIQAASQEEMGVLANGLADTVMIPVMWKCFVDRDSEDIEGTYLFQKTRGNANWMQSLLRMVLLGLLGMAACLAGNGLLQITGLVELFAVDYSSTMEVLYGGSLWLQIFWMVIAAPVAEELVYRKILYGRMREYCSFWKAAVGASLLFGITHGFILQGIYGFLLGMLLCFLLERYKALYPAILVHMAANLCSVVSTVYVPIQSWLGDKRHFTIAAMISVLICVLVVGYLEKTAHLNESEERK